MQSIQPGTLTPLALTVLELLHERAMHPYQMQQVIEERHLHRFVKVRAGSLYHTVERLHRLGLIETVETGRHGRRPERTVYAVTPDGREEYRDRLRSILRHVTPEYPVFGATVEMLHTLDPADVADLLEGRMVELEAKLASLDQVITGLTKRGLDRVRFVEVEYASAITRAELAWVTGLVDDLRHGTLHWHPPQDPAATEPTTEPTTTGQDTRGERP